MIKKDILDNELRVRANQLRAMGVNIPYAPGEARPSKESTTKRFSRRLAMDSQFIISVNDESGRVHMSEVIRSPVVNDPAFRVCPSSLPAHSS